MNKPRCDCPLYQLSEEEQAQLFHWLQTLGYPGTLEQVALPRPDGFGLRTHRASLHRFFIRYSEGLTHADSADLPPEQPADKARLAELTDRSLRQAAFHLSADPASLDAFKVASRWSYRQHQLSLARERIALERDRLSLDREKFEYNAARSALEHHAKLEPILASDQTDNEDKILQARSILFGIPIDKLPK